MPRVSLAFFTAGALCGAAGMVWGSYMGATQNFTLSPAHAHLNLLGWVSLAVMGTFYALSPRSAGRLAWLNFTLSTAGVMLMTPMMAYLLSGHERQVGPMMALPDGLVILGMLIFIANVLRGWRTAAVPT